MKIKDLARIADRPVIKVNPETTLRRAIEILLENNIGALPVCDKNNAILGIVSERDLLKTCAIGPRSIDDTRVGDVMTREIVVAVPEDDLGYISSVMNQKGIRHLPVMSGKKLINMISMRDIVNAQLVDFEVQVRMLNDYIFGGYR